MLVLVERIKSGVPGFDELVEGGIPKGSSVLITGGSGTGKTIFAMEYIYEGARMGEPGLFVTLESNLKNVVWNMQSFQWDIKALQDKNLMKIYRLHLMPSKTTEGFEEQIHSELTTIGRIVKEVGIQRLAIDSTTAFALWIKDMGLLRHVLFEFVDSLKELNCTTLLVSETKGGKTDFSAFGIEEFVVDGVVALYFIPPNRSVFIRKMRGTKHSQTVHPFNITEKGLEIRPKDEILWEALR